MAKIVHGDQNCRPSLFCILSPLVQLVACQLSIIYRGVGGGHSKNTPDHTLQIQGGAEFIAPNGIQDCFADSAVDCPSMFYCQPKQNGFLPEIRKMQDHSIFVLFQKFNQSSPRDNFCGAANR